MTGKSSEFPPDCFSETRNSFTKSESQPKCNSQRRNAGSRLGMCERHLQMTGNDSPSSCGGHGDSSPSLTLYFENWRGLPGDCGNGHTNHWLMQLPKTVPWWVHLREHTAAMLQLTPLRWKEHLERQCWREVLFQRPKMFPGLLCSGVWTSQRLRLYRRRGRSIQASALTLQLTIPSARAA